MSHHNTKYTVLDKLEYEKMFAAEDSYFWFVAKHNLLREILLRELEPIQKPRVLDAGCGTGGFLASTGDRYMLVGMDPGTAALEFCRKRKLKLLVRGDMENIALADNSFHAVVASDVLEHIEDDTGAAMELGRVLSPGGVALITVPGIRWLWGSHDEALGHKRRYARSSIKRLLYNAGFRDVKVFSYMSFTAPLVITMRLVQKIMNFGDAGKTIDYNPPRVINRLLWGMLNAERRLVMAGLDLRIGVTLVAVARKGSGE